MENAKGKQCQVESNYKHIAVNQVTIQYIEKVALDF